MLEVAVALGLVALVLVLTVVSIRRDARWLGNAYLFGLSVLVVEDNDINALLARSALARAGHRVDVVANGKAAVEALTESGGVHRYDVVLMDLHMPVMDGLSAITLIRLHEEKKALPPVPILVLSADSQEKTRHGVIAHGATGFLTKPVDPRAMIEAVENHIAG